jgi:hypothetical protein
VKLPWYIWLFCAILFAFVLYASFFPTCFEKIIPHSQFIILALTLLALLYYAYHTHKLANISAKALELNIKPIFDIQRDESPIYLKIDVKSNYPIYFSNFKVKLEAENSEGKKINPIEKNFKQEFWAMKEDQVRTIFLDMKNDFRTLKDSGTSKIKATITITYQGIEEKIYAMNKEFDYSI